MLSKLESALIFNTNFRIEMLSVKNTYKVASGIDLFIYIPKGGTPAWPQLNSWNKQMG